MIVNQNGHPVEEKQLFMYVGDTELITNQEVKDAIALLTIHLNVGIHRVSADGSGSHLELRDSN